MSRELTGRTLPPLHMAWRTPSPLCPPTDLAGLLPWGALALGSLQCPGQVSCVSPLSGDEDGLWTLHPTEEAHVALRVGGESL